MSDVMLADAGSIPNESIYVKKKRMSDTVLYGLIYLSAAISVLLLLGIIGYVFVNGSPAQITHSCQLADVEVSALVGGVVPEEDCWNVVFGYLRPPDSGSFSGGICHPRPHALPYHSKF